MIDARGLTRRFGEVTAVSQLTFNVAGGAILALLGPNGAGKTTTVRMLAALLAPSEGEATVAGYDVRREPGDVRASVGLMTDAPGLYEQMTVADYLNQFATIYGLKRDERRRRIDYLLEFFELGPYQSLRMVGFSRGMKQKVALARALIHDPPVLFLDEPTASLDPLAARAVRELILNLRQSNRTLVLCTHILDEAERLADEVAILSHGQIVARDAPAVLRAQAGGGTRVHVALAGPSPAAREALAAVAGIAELSVDHAGLTYCTDAPQVVNPQAVSRLVAAGAQVVSITCQAASLEDVYALAVTGEPAAAEDTQDGR